MGLRMRKRASFNLFAFLKNTVVALLLIILGVIVGFRYAREGELLGFRLTFLDDLAQREQNSNLSSLINSSADAPVSMNTFWEVWNLLERDYLESDQIDESAMIDGAISGMVWGLGDPYTTYLAPADNEKAGEDLAGSFYGVGIELGYVNGIVGVVAPLSGSPAEAAGIMAGDMITHVKDLTKDLDEDTTDWTLDDAVKNIRGQRGVPVTLTVLHDGASETENIDVVRDEIVVESVELNFVEYNGKRVAHLKVSKFGERTMTEWNTAVKTILQQENQIAGIVLDLRNNPGGYFDTSIEMASDFVKSGVVVSQKSKYSTKDYKSSGKARLADIPTVLLVNKGSASASEIVAGALRDDLGIKLVGEKTFGKGTVQDRRELSNGGGLHITVGRWLTPAGNWIHDDGLEVDLEVEQNYDTEEDEVLNKGIESL
jgi:carboxyl-terminal processing protease